jgi:hypothetical protein
LRFFKTINTLDELNKSGLRDNMNIANHYLQLEHLRGRWQAKRLILDRYHSFQAYYRGEMIISEAPKSNEKIVLVKQPKEVMLNLSEQGILEKDGTSYNFSQSYQIKLSNNKCEVFFINQTLFFSINRLIKTQTIDHLCNPDRYTGKVIFLKANSFALKFNVSGPKKQYYLKALYKRFD